jgi:Bacterial regulatory proteins, tetR family
MRPHAARSLRDVFCCRADRGGDGDIQLQRPGVAANGLRSLLAVPEIAQQAGVGVGTFYRHFPDRTGLIAAVSRREVDACADAARQTRQR